MAKQHKLLRGHLQSERERLQEQLDQLRVSYNSEDRREGSPFGKREEEANEASELENRLAMEKRVLEQLSEVENALTKFDKGDYGICEGCGEPINPERLEAIPQSKLCLKCKAKQLDNARR